MTFNELIKQFKETEEKLESLLAQLYNTSDGYIYVCCIRCYGSITWESHNNEFTAQRLCGEYYGDNGIVDVYTNNPNHNISNYGDVNIMSLEAIDKLYKNSTNVSMSTAITNWIARAM